MRKFIFCGPAAFGKGGMEKVAIQLANYWSDKNDVVHFGYFSRENQTTPAYAINANVILAPWDRVKVSYAEYKRRIIEAKPHAFLLFGASSQIIEVVSLLNNTEIPLIIHEGSNPERIINENWARPRKLTHIEAIWEREVILSQADRIRLTMPSYLNSLSTPLRSKARAFPNAFDVFESKLDNKRKRVINIGGLKPNKNIFPLLHAFKELKFDYPDWELAIFSAEYLTPKGVEFADKVREFIVSNDLESNVKIYGETDNINIEYETSSIHVITSLSEGLSSSVAEAMCHGLPSIGIRGVPGVDGLIEDDRNGILIENKDLLCGLIKSLKLLINSESLRTQLGANALKDAAKFNSKNIYLKWDEIVKEAIEEKRNKVISNEVELHYKRTVESLYKAVLNDKYISNQNYDGDHKELKIIMSDQAFMDYKNNMFNLDVLSYAYK